MQHCALTSECVTGEERKSLNCPCYYTSSHSNTIDGGSTGHGASQDLKSRLWPPTDMHHLYLILTRQSASPLRLCGSKCPPKFEIPPVSLAKPRLTDDWPHDYEHEASITNVDLQNNLYDVLNSTLGVQKVFMISLP